MPHILKRLSRRSSVPPVEQPGLIPMDDLPSSQRLYGSKNMVIGTEGRVSTEAGVFSQILGPEERLFSIPAIGRDSEGMIAQRMEKKILWGKRWVFETKQRLGNGQVKRKGNGGIGVRRSFL